MSDDIYNELQQKVHRIALASLVQSHQLQQQQNPIANSDSAHSAPEIIGNQTTISAQDFLHLGCMSKGVVLLPHESRSSTPNSSSGSSKQLVENAARVALVLARSFHDCIGEHEGMVNNLQSIHLYNVSITLCNNQTVGDLHHEFSDGTVIVYGASFPTMRGSSGDQQQVQQEHCPTLAQIRILGQLLCSIFCFGDRDSPSVAAESSSSNDGDVDGSSVAQHSHATDGSERSHKSLRVSENTVYRKLIDKGSLPKPICRLLSDMIDSGKATSPFASIKDIIKDLEQMINQPDIFLHDPQTPPMPMFGKKYHGRKEEVATLVKLSNQIMQQSSFRTGLQTVFISGSAGSGKSHLTKSVGDCLSDAGWLVIQAKFERSSKHTSRLIASAMFDDVIKYLAKMKESGDSIDVKYSEFVTKSILNDVGRDALPGLVGFLPTLPTLFNDLHGTMQANGDDWQLVYSLSKIIKATLEEPHRYLMICCDDIQWSDKKTFSLISEVLMSIAGWEGCRRCLFIGLYRHEEIHDNHPFHAQHSQLLNNAFIISSEIKLGSLSKEDVTDMISEELRLPHHSVATLADVVQKKTAGHALFVVTLLNSFLRDSIILYNSEQERYYYDQDRLDFVETEDNVAEFIASNLKNLSLEHQQILLILSCFGTQTDESLLQLLELFHKGILASINTFVDGGILDRAGPLVRFAHDLIQQSCYEMMPLYDQRALHLRLGKFLGLKATNNDASNEPMGPVIDGLDQLRLTNQVFFAGRSMTSHLISLACDQINLAGLESLTVEDKKRTYAEWNLLAAKKSTRQSNFNAAFYYLSHGIDFLGEQSWSNDYTLCLQLYNGAVRAAIALGKADLVEQYTQKVIEHASFHDTLEVQTVYLKFLTHSQRHEECISRGVGILRQLNFHIPPIQSKDDIRNALASVDTISEESSFHHWLSQCQKNDFIESAGEIVNGLGVSCFNTASPLLPLISCEVVKLCFHIGQVCPQIAVSFVTVAMFQINFNRDYKKGKFWADAARKIIKNSSAKDSLKDKISELSVELRLHMGIDIYFVPATPIASTLLRVHNEAMRIGQVDTAAVSLGSSVRFELLGGLNLKRILQTFEERYRLMAKHSKIGSKFGALDAILLTELTGKSVDCFAVFGDSISSTYIEAEKSKDMRFLYNFHVYTMLLAFWKNDFAAAEEHFVVASVNPTSKMPQFLVIYYTFFGALVSFHLFRKSGGQSRLKQGQDLMDEVAVWSHCSNAFENKWLLLRAEYSACVNDGHAEELYLASIKSAENSGNVVHELGMAHELLGDYYATHGRTSDSINCYNNAYIYYTQWGATAVAERLSNEHNLVSSLSTGVAGSQQPAATKKRQCD